MEIMCPLVAVELMFATALMAALITLEALVSVADRRFRVPTIGV